MDDGKGVGVNKGKEPLAQDMITLSQFFTPTMASLFLAWLEKKIPSVFKRGMYSTNHREVYRVLGELEDQLKEIVEKGVEV